MAGNWKMNLNHLEAIAHVQKLAFALADKDYEAVEVAVLPPFTDLRSVQTLVDGDKLKIKYGAQDISAHDSGAYTGEISGPMLAKLKCTYVAIGHSERRQYHDETDELVQRQGQGRLQARPDPDPVRRRGAGRPRGGQPRRPHPRPGRRRPEGPPGRAGRDRRDRVRAGVGHRHRQGLRRRGRAGGLRGDPRPSSPSSTPRSWPTRSASSTAAR